MSVNLNYFSKINTRAKAYILGYIAGDGYVYSNGNSYYVSINSIDLDILEYIKEQLKYDGKIREYKKGMHTLRICGKQLVDDLAKYGVVQKKSKITKFPEQLSKNLQLAFIAGIFDADGSIHVPEDNYKWRRFRRINFSGSKNMILGIKQVLESVGFSKIKLKVDPKTYILQYVTKHVELFYKKIYSKSPYRLKRKEKKFTDNEIVRLSLFG